jgi:hypothetical protein
LIPWQLVLVLLLVQLMLTVLLFINAAAEGLPAALA